MITRKLAGRLSNTYPENSQIDKYNKLDALADKNSINSSSQVFDNCSVTSTCLGKSYVKAEVKIVKGVGKRLYTNPEPHHKRAV
jgi:hypothetical protein